MTPNDRKYTREHEWILVEGNAAKIGISDHAQEALGDIVFVELPEVGVLYGAGDSIAVVESVKAVSNIYTAVAGKVLEVNEELETQPELLNESPYDHFIASLEIESLNESELMDAAAYDAFVQAEG